MSGYQRINFKDQNVERPKTYDVTNNPDGSITLIESFGNVEELGTPINQENMNHIEDGIDAVSFSKFNIDSVYKKDDLITDIQDSELKIFKSLKDNNFGHLPSEKDFWEEVEIAGGNGSGYNLGDTKITDHILEGDEAKGMALQGTYVSGALYPDFYNKWLEQYRNSQAITTYTPQDITFIGSVTNNDWVVGNFSVSNYIKIEKNLLNIASTANSFEIVTKITTGSDVTTSQIVIGQGVSESAKGYNSVTIGVNAGHFGGGISYNNGNQGFTGSYAVQPNTTYYLKYEFTSTAQNIYYATEKDNWILDVTKASSGNLSTSTYDLTIGAWRTNNTTPVRPFSGTVDLKETYIKVDGEDWFIPLATETYYQNANKRRFYPIAEKPKYDEMYETYGIADYYGIDEENERIFLPRNKYFFQLTDDVSKVNNMVEAGLPNLAGTISGTHSNVEWSGVFKRTNNIDNLTGSSYAGFGCASGTFNASDFNPIYGNSDTVQPPSSLKLLYYCVGNTVVNDSEIDAGALVAEMEQKANIFLDNTLPTKDFANTLNNVEIRTVIETYQNGTSWYRVWSDGWCEQGGQIASGADTDYTGTLLKAYRDINYDIGLTSMSYNTSTSAVQWQYLQIRPVTNSTFFTKKINFVRGWRASGYIR